jgi:hypothetical protein
MNWFDKWLYKKTRDMWDNSYKYQDEGIKMGTAAVLSTGERSIDANGFTLKVFRANGGTIIETRKYDMKRDTSNNGLYIITDDKDLGDEIGKIITMEGLKA